MVGIPRTSQRIGVNLQNLKVRMKDYVAEFGSTFPVRFLTPSQVTMYDSDGKEVMCKCGKPATSSIIGKDAFIAQCSECFFKEVI